MDNTTYISSFSHEIRTPLNGIVGYTQLLSQTKLDSLQASYLNSMSHCCIQLMEIVNDILDFSKLQSGTIQFHKSCFSFKELIEEVKSMVDYKITEKRQKLRFILASDLPEYIITDKQKLIQIILNLVSNANKYTEIGGRIIVSIQMLKDQIEVNVEDTGIGIKNVDIEKLFRPFSQLNDNGQSGAGLGLAICKKLVDLFQGKISVVSEYNVGSTFSFTFSFEKFDQIQKYIEANKNVLANKYILIVEPDIDIRLSIEDILFDYGSKPIICSTEKEAIRMISGKRFSFSVILLDISFSRDIVKKLRELNPEVLIIGLSNLEDNSILYSHYTSIITKPINNLKLLDTIIRTIHKDDISSFELNNVEEVKEPSTQVKILIAEDNQYNIEMLSKMLTNLGYTDIDLAKDGVEALEKLRKTQYNILLLDLKMPRMDGFTLAGIIREEKINIKTCVLTASVLEQDKERCKELGIKYFLVKPINISHLKMILRRLVYGTA